MITVTKGQWFPLTIGNISYAGAAFDLQGATEVSVSLVSTLGVKSALSFEITAYNEISAVCDGSLSAGKYGIEVSCKGADGKSYRMKSPGAIIEVSASTTPSTGSTSVRVAGDEWELTADVEMHEEQARTYMSLLEEARKAAIKAADDAEAVIDNVQSSVTQAQEAAKTALQASTNAEDAVTKANNAVSDANNALQSITTMEGTVNTAEQGRKDAESERVTAEQGRKDAESERVTAEQARVTAETARSEAEQGRVEAENGRVEAEQGRVEAETAREQGYTEKSAHLEELLQYIKDNHLEVDAKFAEAIKNTITGTDVFVYLDTTDGNVKSMPNTNQLGANVAAVYYAGKRSIIPPNNYQMLAGNSLLRSLDLSGWDFEAATNMSRFLYNATKLKTLTLPDNMTLANVTDMSSCFKSCGSLQSLDTSKWTLANVTSMSYCFDSCGSLQSLDTSKWTLANVTSMYRCFNFCSCLREIDLSSCNITKCIDWERWIYGCSLLKTLRIGLIDFSLCGGVDFLSDTGIRELTGTLKGIKNNFTAVSNRMTRDSCMVVINGLEMVTEAKTLTLGANNKPVSLGGKGNDPISDDDLKVATDKGWTVQFANRLD